MQPWETEKRYSPRKSKKQKRSFVKKVSLATNAVVLSTVACTFIYGSVMYECFKEIIYKIDPKLKK
tara:strand:- start:324 stop:521 length:198 start_codon:yes stop_codon:yes gene_type:complete